MKKRENGGGRDVEEDEEKEKGCAKRMSGI